MYMRGTFIVIEGPDASGTTRQSSFLAERIQQEQAEKELLVTAEPTSGSIGQTIRTLLHGEEMPQADAMQLLFCADRAQHLAKEIIPALEAGKIVISDRYALSTIIYGAALGLDEQWLRNLNNQFLKPDITIIALPPFEVCMERMHNRNTRDQYEKQEFQKKVYDGYAALNEPNSFFVDTSQTKEASAEEIWAHIEPILK